MTEPVFGFRPGSPQTELYSHRGWSEAWNFGLRLKMDCSYLSCENEGSDQLQVSSAADLRLCFRIYQKKKNRFSHNAGHMIISDGTGGLRGHLSLVLRKPVFGISDHVRHKPVCTATQDGYRIEISDLGSRGIVLSV